MNKLSQTIGISLILFLLSCNSDEDNNNITQESERWLSVPVDLPSEDVYVESESLKINITTDNHYFLDSDIDSTEFEFLYDAILKKKDENGINTIKIYADKNASYYTVFEIISISKELDLTVAFASD